MARRKEDAVSGVIVIDKHEGVTSYRIIQIMRRMFDTSRVGHTGTLDPLATGVLPVLLGRAVKASEYVTAYDKRYVAEMKLGLTTDTEDITGEVLTRSDRVPEEAAVLEAIRSFEGEYDQVPPMYSALKVDGRKLVDIAREGGEVERQPRRVRIDAIGVERLDGDTYRLDVSCSKGTYIRTLCADIGKKLGCGAVMSALRRVRTGDFTVEESHTVEELEGMTFEERAKLLKPVESLFGDYREVILSEFFARLFTCGVPLYRKKIRLEAEDGELFTVRCGNRFLGLGKADKDKDGNDVMKMEKLFYLGKL